MSIERGKELQVQLAKEAVALMVLHGKHADVQPFKESITLVGDAWDIPVGDTATAIELVNQELEAVSAVENPADAKHVLPESELPMNATGTETLDNIWDLFEAAVQLDSKAQRNVLYNMARLLEELQNLLDWIEKTPAERELPAVTAD